MTPVLLIPGLACSPRVFAPQLPALWRCGPVSIAATHQGDNFREMAAVILRQAPERFALAGFSMGAYISFEILRQAPERVLGLALLSASARAETRSAQRRRARFVALAQQGKLELVKTLNFPRAVHSSRASDALLCNTVQQMAQETAPQAYLRQQNALMSRVDSRPMLSEIHCPTLVLVGDEDPITPLTHAQEIASGISGAQLVCVAQCGHFSTLEQPGAVTAALLDWLARTNAL